MAEDIAKKKKKRTKRNEIANVKCHGNGIVICYCI